MDDLLRLLLTNAGSACLIALLAWAASRTIRRQAVVHGLWLLALVRLVTPPIAPVPLVPAWPGLALTSPRRRRRPSSPCRPAPRERPSTGPAASSRAAVRLPAAVAIRSLAAPPAGPILPPRPPFTVPAWRAAAWLSLAAGALAITLLTAWRFARFGRLLACAQPAPDAIAERAAALAARLGLRRVPPVLLVPARIPPMLWPHRAGPRLLLPAGLLPDLHADELDTLLAHELAHVRRRDHWVRLVEIAATALFWWYPVTWWARRALRRAEERCCDEWVLRLLPRSAEAYANGLLKSLTFVAGTPGALPSLASGVGPVEDIEARLKEILMTRPVPRLAAPIRLTLAAAAALGLAVFPTHAQSSATKEEPAAPAAATPTAAAPPPPPSLPSRGRRWRRGRASLRARPSPRSRLSRRWPPSRRGPPSLPSPPPTRPRRRSRPRPPSRRSRAAPGRATPRGARSRTSAGPSRISGGSCSSRRSSCRESSSIWRRRRSRPSCAPRPPAFRPTDTRTRPPASREQLEAQRAAGWSCSADSSAWSPSAWPSRRSSRRRWPRSRAGSRPSRRVGTRPRRRTRSAPCNAPWRPPTPRASRPSRSCRRSSRRSRPR